MFHICLVQFPVSISDNISPSFASSKAQKFGTSWTWDCKDINLIFQCHKKISLSFMHSSKQYISLKVTRRWRTLAWSTASSAASMQRGSSRTSRSTNNISQFFISEIRLEKIFSNLTLTKIAQGSCPLYRLGSRIQTHELLILLTKRLPIYNSIRSHLLCSEDNFPFTAHSINLKW